MKNPAAANIHLLTDECVSRVTVEFLKSLGIHVVTAAEFGLIGCANGEVLHRAIQNNMLFLTEDKDFCNILNFPPSQSHGTIVLKATPINRPQVNIVLKNLLFEIPREAFEKTLFIVDAAKYRTRKE